MFSKFPCFLSLIHICSPCCCCCFIMDIPCLLLPACSLTFAVDYDYGNCNKTHAEYMHSRPDITHHTFVLRATALFSCTSPCPCTPLCSISVIYTHFKSQTVQLYYISFMLQLDGMMRHGGSWSYFMACHGRNIKNLHLETALKNISKGFRSE